jgi:proteasome lid subunit RPN8/RPN11
VSAILAPRRQVSYFGRDGRHVVNLENGHPLPAFSRSRHVAAPAGSRRARSGRDVFLYHRPSEPDELVFTVREQAIDDIERIDQAENELELYEPREVAGYLLARQRDPATVIAAVAAYRDATPNSVIIEARLAPQGSPLAVVGEWHIHTNGTRSPSEHDLRAFGLELEASEAPVWLSLIATPGETGLRLHGWATRPRACGGAKCEPARIEIRP